MTGAAESNPATVLLVDDEKHVRHFARALLTPLNWQIVGEAANGEEAVAFYKARRPDVVLLDLNMPVKDGRTALREIREFDRQARVVILSSMCDLETIQSVRDLGAIGYLRKDTPVDELRALLDAVLRRQLIH